MLKKIKNGNSSIAYRIDGKGPTLLLLHGFCEDSSMWDSFKMPFEQNYTVICPDLPGFGQSDALEKIKVEDMADAVHQVLLAEQISSCIFVGHSMGGYVAMAFAEKYPDKLKGLCLFHSHPFADTEEKKLNRAKTIEFMERWGSPAFVRELVPKLFLKDFVLANPDFISRFIEKAEQFPQRGIVAATRAMIERPDRSGIMSNLKCPILFIIGKFDEAIPAEFSDAQLKLRRDAMVFILPVAHMGMFEAKEECTKIIKSFLLQ